MATRTSRPAVAEALERRIEKAYRQGYQQGARDGYSAAMLTVQSLVGNLPITPPGVPEACIIDAELAASTPYTKPVESLELSAVARERLKNDKGVITIGDLLRCTPGQVRGIRLIGPKRMAEIVAKLAAAGYQLLP